MLRFRKSFGPENSTSSSNLQLIFDFGHEWNESASHAQASLLCCNARRETRTWNIPSISGAVSGVVSCHRTLIDHFYQLESVLDLHFQDIVGFEFISKARRNGNNICFYLNTFFVSFTFWKSWKHFKCLQELLLFSITRSWNKKHIASILFLFVFSNTQNPKTTT